MIGVSVITFAISHVIPADPAVAALGDHATEDQVAAFRAEYHLDRPLPEQYATYVIGILHGDLGKSIRTRRAVADDLADSFPATLELSFAALAVSLLVGIPAGIWSAIYRGRLPDVIVRIAALAGGSLPVFWLGLIVIGLGYYQLGWFPGGGRLDPFVSPPPTRTGLYVIDSLLALDLDALRSSLIHLVLPSLTLGYFSTAVISRMTRSSMLEVLGQDYMRTARATGLSRSRVLVYALRNALVPVVTIGGMSFGYMFGWALIIESVFNISGLSRALLTAIQQRDFVLVQGIVMVFTFIFILANLVADVTNGWLNP